jgi:hypothetical protein
LPENLQTADELKNLLKRIWPERAKRECTREEEKEESVFERGGERKN